MSNTIIAMIVSAFATVLFLATGVPWPTGSALVLYLVAHSYLGLNDIASLSKQKTRFKLYTVLSLGIAWGGSVGLSAMGFECGLSLLGLLYVSCMVMFITEEIKKRGNHEG